MFQPERAGQYLHLSGSVQVDGNEPLTPGELSSELVRGKALPPVRRKNGKENHRIYQAASASW